MKNLSVLQQIVDFCAGGKTSSELRAELNLPAQRVSRDLWHLMRQGRIWRIGGMGYGRYFNTEPTPEQVAQVDAEITYQREHSIYRRAHRSDPESLARRRERDTAKRREKGILPPGQVVRKALTIKKAEPSIKHAAQVVIPADVKITVCRPCQVERYRFDPPKGWKGEITRDWLDQRSKAA